MIERLLDSVILIDHFNDIPRRARFLSAPGPIDDRNLRNQPCRDTGRFDEDSIEKPKALLDQFT